MRRRKDVMSDYWKGMKKWLVLDFVYRSPGPLSRTTMVNIDDRRLR